MAEQATQRLSRLLAMVPWLLAHPGQELERVAHHFDISVPQLIKDLELLFVCGTPGHFPDDLIDADWESGRVYLRNADAIAAPVRLGLDEAAALIVGLRAVLEVPDPDVTGAAASALETLSAAASEAAQAADAVQVDVSAPVPQAVAVVRSAIARHHQIAVEYLVPSRDEVTTRVVDPWRLFADGRHWYTEGWCHRAREVRTFRVDRMVTCVERDTMIEHPAPASDAGSTQVRFVPAADSTPVQALLAPAAQWVSEYVPCEVLGTDSQGWQLVRLQVAQPQWIVRLALRLGGLMRVTEPATMVADIRSQAEAALALNESYDT